MLEQVVVVADLLLPLFRLVGLRKRREAVPDVRIVREMLLNRRLDIELDVARERDDPEERARPGVRLVLEERLVMGVDDLLQEALRLLGVQDREGLCEPDRLAEHPEGPVADRVEGPPPEPLRLDAGQLLDAVEHLLRRLVGEGEQQDLAGAHPFREKPRDAVREGARLSRSRARKDEQGARLGRHGAVLLVVELRAKVDQRDRVGRGMVPEDKIHEGRSWPLTGAGGELGVPRLGAQQGQDGENDGPDADHPAERE